MISTVRFVFNGRYIRQWSLPTDKSLRLAGDFWPGADVATNLVIRSFGKVTAGRERGMLRPPTN